MSGLEPVILHALLEVSRTLLLAAGTAVIIGGSKPIARELARTDPALQEACNVFLGDLYKVQKTLEVLKGRELGASLSHIYDAFDNWRQGKSPKHDIERAYDTSTIAVEGFVDIRDIPNRILSTKVRIVCLMASFVLEPEIEVRNKIVNCVRKLFEVDSVSHLLEQRAQGKDFFQAELKYEVHEQITQLISVVSAFIGHPYSDIDTILALTTKGAKPINLWSCLIQEISSWKEDTIIHCMKVEQDFLYTGLKDGSVRIWNRDTGECVHTLRGHTGGVCAVAVEEGRIYSASEDTTICVWDRKTGKCIDRLKGHTSSVLCLTLDAQHVFSGSENGKICMWSKDTGQCMEELELHSGSVLCIQIEGEHLLSGSSDNTLHSWNIRTKEKMFSCLHSAPVCSISIRQDLISTSDADGVGYTWNKEGAPINQYTDRVIGEKARKAAMVGAVAGGLIGTALGVGVLGLSYKQRQKRKEVCQDLVHYNCVALMNNVLVLSSWNGKVYFWSLEGGKLLRVVKYPHPATAIEIFRGELVIALADGTVRLWKFPVAQTACNFLDQVQVSSMVHLVQGNGIQVNDNNNSSFSTWSSFLRHSGLNEEEASDCERIFVQNDIKLEQLRDFTFDFLKMLGIQPRAALQIMKHKNVTVHSVMKLPAPSNNNVNH